MTNLPSGAGWLSSEGEGWRMTEEVLPDDLMSVVRATLVGEPAMLAAFEDAMKKALHSPEPLTVDEEDLLAAVLGYPDLDTALAQPRGES
jgi:hypothetical protein